MTEHQGRILSGQNSYNSWQQRSSRFFSTYLFYLMCGYLEAGGNTHMHIARVSSHLH